MPREPWWCMPFQLHAGCCACCRAHDPLVDPRLSWLYVTVLQWLFFGMCLQVSYDMAGAVGGLPSLWSAEEPRLYWLRIELQDSSGHLLEAESCMVGFRHVEVTQRHLLVNKRPIMIKGVNRHEHDQRRGKVVSEVRCQFNAAQVR